MTQWLAVFCDPEPLPLGACRRDRFLYWALNTFLRPGFRHVFLMRPAHGFDGWIVVNPNSACLDVLELDGDDYVRFVRSMEEAGHATIVSVTARRPEQWVPRSLLSCVSVAKHVLGVECDLCATPWQLYNILLKGHQAMGGFFSPPKAPDTSAADAARAQAEAERDDAKKKNEAKTRNAKNRGRGRSLLAFADTGMEGVQAKEKLGQ